MKSNKYIIFAGMGFELVGIIVTSVLLGQFLDQKYDLHGLAMIGLSMGGLGGWLYHIVLLAKKLDQNKEP